MTDQKTFAELWCDGEEKCSPGIKVSQLLEELVIKANLYKALDARKFLIPPEEYQKLKLRTMGELLLTMTGVSMQDDINVYEALALTLADRK
jgi:hypothetical protein